jgi:hypothetical protein
MAPPLPELSGPPPLAWLSVKVELLIVAVEGSSPPNPALFSMAPPTPKKKPSLSVLIA